MPTSSIISYCRMTNDKLIVNGKNVTTYKTPGLQLSDIYHDFDIQYPKFFKMDNLCKAGFIAAELLLKDVDFDREQIKDSWAVSCIERSSSLDDDKQFQNTIRDAENYYPSPAIFVYTLANIVTGELAIRHKIGGESSCYIMEKLVADKFVSLMNLSFQDKQTEYILGGWIDFLDGQCDVLMMLIQKDKETAQPFTPEQIKQLYDR